MVQLENKTPTTRKQTFWVNLITFISMLLVTVTDNTWFMENFTQTGAYAGMALTGVTIVLGFLNPIGHKKNLEMLETGDEHENSSI